MLNWLFKILIAAALVIILFDPSMVELKQLKKKITVPFYNFFGINQNQFQNDEDSISTNELLIPTYPLSDSIQILQGMDSIEKNPTK